MGWGGKACKEATSEQVHEIRREEETCRFEVAIGRSLDQRAYANRILWVESGTYEGGMRDGLIAKPHRHS